MRRLGFCRMEQTWHGPDFAADANDSAAVSAAAAALAAGGIPEVAVPFDEGVVGPFGAGFDWTRDAGAAPFVFTASAPARPSECDSEAGDFTKVRAWWQLVVLSDPMRAWAAIHGMVALCAGRCVDGRCGPH